MPFDILFRWSSPLFCYFDKYKCVWWQGLLKHFSTFFSFFVIYIDKRKKIVWVEMKIISISKLRGVACALLSAEYCWLNLFSEKLASTPIKNHHTYSILLSYQSNSHFKLYPELFSNWKYSYNKYLFWLIFLNVCVGCFSVHRFVHWYLKCELSW